MTMMTNMKRPVYSEPAPTAEWSVAEAKARFSELVAKAKAGVPQRVTRYGKDEVVVVSMADWESLQADRPGSDDPDDQPGSLLEIFAPLIGSGIVIERIKGGFRPVFGEDD
jgi:prevent-host-death family protein